MGLKGSKDFRQAEDGEGRKGSFAARLGQMARRVESRVGKVAFSGRYYKAPRKIEDDYNVSRQVLGRGMSGEVKMATSRKSWRSSKQKFAIKAFKLANLTADMRKQLVAEVEIFLSMDHPHVTRLLAVYESADFLHLVMECMEGGELFDRVAELTRFTERDAANCVWQMLLALNYIHSQSIAHRDLKLENWMFDRKGSNHLKLIDFGLSRAFNPNIKMRGSCGTLTYAAPEVLGDSYTSQCDLWSLGVITFIILVGRMPFGGSDKDQWRDIAAGRYVMEPEQWKQISPAAIDFTKSLLQVDPKDRLSAQSALEHRWIAERNSSVKAEIDVDVVDALRKFGQASKFRRCCMEMMAWSLTNEDRAKVRQQFISMDESKSGTITLSELKTALTEKSNASDDETLAIFAALDSNSDEVINYADFLAAMISTRITLHDDLLRTGFRKFDTDHSGFITVNNLRQVLGDAFDGEEVEKLIGEVDVLQDGGVSYPEFVSFLCGDTLDGPTLAVDGVIDSFRSCASYVAPAGGGGGKAKGIAACSPLCCAFLG